MPCSTTANGCARSRTSPSPTSASSVRARERSTSFGSSAWVTGSASSRRWGSTSAPTDRSRWPSASWPRCSPSMRGDVPSTCARNAEASMTDDRSGRVAAVVLAAGTSSRMGRNKLFLQLGGTSVLRRAVAAALEAGLDPVIVVLGHESDRARAELAGSSCTTLVNPEYARGMNTSVGAGVAAVPGDAIGAVLMLADMPLVDAGMLRALIERHRESSAPLVVSTYGDVLAPPILYGRALFPELSALDPEGCGKRVVKQHRGEAVELSWPPSALSDLDVPEDVERVRAQMERS